MAWMSENLGTKSDLNSFPYSEIKKSFWRIFSPDKLSGFLDYGKTSFDFDGQGFPQNAEIISWDKVIFSLVALWQTQNLSVSKLTEK